VQRTAYTRRQARALLVLVRSIGRELAERMEAVEALEGALLRAAPRGESSDAFRLASADAATHCRAIRHARDELERLGGSIVGESPLTLRIRVEEGGRSESLLWQHRPGDAAPRATTATTSTAAARAV